MKQAAALLLLLCTLAALTGCGTEKTVLPFVATESEAAQEEPQSEETRTEKPEANILVVYFSRTGNTKALAEYAIDLLNADSFEIEAAVPYTDEDIAYYTDCRADREQADPAVRPEIANQVPDIQQYDMIVLGYPIWHGQAPRIFPLFWKAAIFPGKRSFPSALPHQAALAAVTRICTAFAMLNG